MREAKLLLTVHGAAGQLKLWKIVPGKHPQLVQVKTNKIKDKMKISNGN